MRANEQSITGGKLTFHILPPKRLTFRRNLLVYWLLPYDPHFPTSTENTAGTYNLAVLVETCVYPLSPSSAQSRFSETKTPKKD